MILKYLNYENLKNLGFIWIFSFFNILFSFLSQTILARNLSVNNFGLFSSYMGFINILIPIVGFGITTYWLKSYGENNLLSKKLIFSTLLFYIMSYTVIYFAVIFSSGLHGFDDLPLFSLLSLILIGTLLTEMISTIFQLSGNYFKFSLSQSVIPFARLISLIFVMYFLNKNSIINIALIWGLSTIVPPIIFYRTFKNKILSTLKNFKNYLNYHNLNQFKHIIKKASIFGLTGVLYLAWSQGHIVFAKLRFGDYEAGLYSSVIILCIAISMFPNVIFSKFLAPTFHQLIYDNPSKLKSLFLQTNIYLFLFGIISTIVIFLLSEIIINNIFGSKYSDAIEVLQVISLTFPMRFCGFNSGLILSTRDFLKTKFIILIIIVFLNFILASVLSDFYGIKALAISIVISEFILVSIYLYVTKIKLCTLTKNML